MEALAAQPRRACCRREERVEEACWCLSLQLRCYLHRTVVQFDRIMGQRGRRSARDRGRGRLLPRLNSVSCPLRTRHAGEDNRMAPRFEVSASVHHRHRRSVSRGVPKRRPWDTRRSAGRLMRLDDSCAHVLFWIVVVTAIDALTMPSYRVMGVAAAVYALSSVLWVALLGSGVAFSSMIMLAPRTPSRSPPFSANGSGQGAWSRRRRKAQRAIPNHDCAPSSGDLTGEHVSRAIAVRCEDIAVANKLSPRETEIFILLLREEREPSSRKNWCLPRTR